MARMTQLRLMVCALVSVILIGGGAFTASADDLRRIVTFENIDLTNPLGLAIARSIIAASGSSEVHNLSFINTLAIELPAINTTGALAYLQSTQYVQEVGEDPVGSVGRISPTLAPIGVEDMDWGLKRIGMLDAHQRWPELKGKGVKVAVLDTGIDSDHPELNTSGGYNALPGGKSPKDDQGHGTQMAGIINATVNDKGIEGAAYQATLVPVKVFDQNGSGHLSDFLNGMQWVYRTDIRLANMSVQFRDNSHALELATKRLYERGVIMVAAAGNRCSSGPPDEGGGGDGDSGGCDTATVYDSSQTEVTYPARYPWVISVAATGYFDRVTAYSRSGKVDLVAPGGSRASGILILTTILGGGYGRGSGTSHAAAHVTGTCALALQRYPGLSFEQALELLGRTARNLIDPETQQSYPTTQQGRGLIDAEKLLEAL